MKNLILIVVLSFMFVACASKVKILDTQAVSMTNAGMEKNQKAQGIGPITGQFCMDTFNDKGELGLMDEAIKDAQTKSGADYITEATFWAQGNCVVVEGTGQKIVR